MVSPHANVSIVRCLTQIIIQQREFTIAEHLVFSEICERRRISSISNKHCDVNRSFCSEGGTQIDQVIYGSTSGKILIEHVTEKLTPAHVSLLQWEWLNWGIDPSVCTHLLMYSFYPSRCLDKTQINTTIPLSSVREGDIKSHQLERDFLENVFACIPDSFAQGEQPVVVKHMLQDNSWKGRQTRQGKEERTEGMLLCRISIYERFGPPVFGELKDID